jgi:hypothetical protein
MHKTTRLSERAANLEKTGQYRQALNLWRKLTKEFLSSVNKEYAQKRMDICAYKIKQIQDV